MVMPVMYLLHIDSLFTVDNLMVEKHPMVVIQVHGMCLLRRLLAIRCVPQLLWQI